MHLIEFETNFEWFPTIKPSSVDCFPTTRSPITVTPVFVFTSKDIRSLFFSFRFGGLMTLFHCSIYPDKFGSYHHTRENSERGLCNSSLSVTLSLSQVTVVLGFVFYIISAFSYLPRENNSVPRHPPVIRYTDSADGALDTRRFVRSGDTVSDSQWGTRLTVGYSLIVVSVFLVRSCRRPYLY
jgi:hypothetical protein